MQIGIDLGASKIEYVLLDDVGNEHHRERTEVPKNYKDTLSIIKKIVIELERKAGKELPVGVCHPGIHSIQTGLVKNAPNSFWINGKPLQRDLRNEIGKEIYCENDANCFALSEAIDGSGKHYKIVFGVILGSGVGGGLVIDKRIVNGPNGITGEWGHNQIPSACIEGVLAVLSPRAQKAWRRRCVTIQTRPTRPHTTPPPSRWGKFTGIIPVFLHIWFFFHTGMG